MLIGWAYSNCTLPIAHTLVKCIHVGWTNVTFHSYRLSFVWYFKLVCTLCRRMYGPMNSMVYMYVHIFSTWCTVDLLFAKCPVWSVRMDRRRERGRGGREVEGRPMKRVRSLIVQLYCNNNSDLVHNLECYTYSVLLPLASNMNKTLNVKRKLV